MAPETATHDRIYWAIKRDILDLNCDPNMRVDIQGVADRCSASVTPVREALYRLMGEGIISAHPEGGFRFAHLDFQHLANLYAWTAQQLLSALHISGDASIRDALNSLKERYEGEIADTAFVAAEIFEAIARATNNGEYVAAIERANLRLRFSRLAESRLFGDHVKELRTFFRNGTIDVKANVRRRVIAYHRRRIEHAAQISALVISSG